MRVNEVIIRLEQLNPTIGDLLGNKKMILDALAKAEADGVDILILPELVVCGYPPMDLIERKIFRELCYNINEEIINATDKTTIIFGSITENTSKIGRACFNSAIVAKNKKEIGCAHKALLPTYDVFDDLRYFEPGKGFDPINISGISFGITICEDREKSEK